MQPITMELDPYLQNQVEAGSSGLDIIHGHLKVLMYERERLMEAAQNGELLLEDEFDESDDYHLGYLNALSDLYTLTYQLSFAIGERNSDD